MTVTNSLKLPSLSRLAAPPLSRKGTTGREREEKRTSSKSYDSGAKAYQKTGWIVQRLRNSKKGFHISGRQL